MMSTVSWVDGDLAASVPVDDRGLLYGDGVFETLLVHHGDIVAWRAHHARLERACCALGIHKPAQSVLARDLDTMRDTMRDAPWSCLRLTVTRGGGERGYAPPSDSSARRIWSWSPMDPDVVGWRAGGIELAWLSTPLQSSSTLGGLKHLNRLEQVMAAQELSGTGADEGLLCAVDGAVIEGVSANVFVRTGNVLRTPCLDVCGVAGVARGRVMDIAATLGLSLEVGRIERRDLLDGDEVFLTNSLRGARPVARLEDRTWQSFETARRAHDHLIPKGSCA
ncbi:MAG: aminodeoxychorismate lyase [Pseudomonadota bacterium]